MYMYKLYKDAYNHIYMYIQACTCMFSPFRSETRGNMERLRRMIGAEPEEKKIVKRAVTQVLTYTVHGFLLGGRYPDEH